MFTPTEIEHHLMKNKVNCRFCDLKEGKFYTSPKPAKRKKERKKERKKKRAWADETFFSFFFFSDIGKNKAVNMIAILEEYKIANWDIKAVTMRPNTN